MKFKEELLTEDFFIDIEYILLDSLAKNAKDSVKYLIKDLRTNYQRNIIAEELWRREELVKELRDKKNLKKFLEKTKYIKASKPSRKEIIKNCKTDLAKKLFI
jgi:hypothetical protein